MASQHRGRQHLRLIASSPEPGAEHRSDAPAPAMNVLTAPTMTPITEELAPVRPHLFALRELKAEPEKSEAPEEPDFTQGAVEGSLEDVMATAEQNEHLTRENFQDSDFRAARRRSAAAKAGRTLGMAYEPVDPADIGANLPTEQFPPVLPPPDDAS